MTSDLWSKGPRLPENLLTQPAAIEYIGERVCPDWRRNERQEARRADEGAATKAPPREAPPREPPETAPVPDVCVTCGAPATLIRAGRAYCEAHQGEPLAIPPKQLEALERQRAQVAAMPPAPPATADEIGDAPDEFDDPPDVPPADPGAVNRWARTHAALWEKVLDGKLPAFLLEPPTGNAASGRQERPSAEGWRAIGFPGPYKARISYRGVPVWVIFDKADLDAAFPAGAPAETTVAEAPREHRAGACHRAGTEADAVRTGPKTCKTENAAKGLFDKLESGEITAEAFPNVYTEEAIAKEYGVSKTTAGKARRRARSRFLAIQETARNTNLK